jgi:hypothetical protein
MGLQTVTVVSSICAIYCESSFFMKFLIEYWQQFPTEAS